MPDLSHLLTFALVALGMVLTPGPNMIYLVSRSISQGAQAGLISLKGHRVLGGMRASLYNAMPEEGVLALADFMREFQQRHG